MRPVLFSIERAGPGRLSTMTRPSGDRLAEQIAGLAANGVTVLVSMLSDSEVAELGLAGEGDLAAAAGLAFYRLSTPDRQVPDRAGTVALAEQLRSLLRRGADVAVHCYAGIGRCSTLAAAVLVLDGLEPADAWQRIAAARGLPVPDTAAQREFIDNLSGLAG
jgi:protein-tyrosine phosphatase